jgi:hypothetical protein
LIGACCHEDDPAKDVARAGHVGIEQTATRERLLRQGGDEREGNSDEQRVGNEPGGGDERGALRVDVSARAGVHDAIVFDARGCLFSGDSAEFRATVLALGRGRIQVVG